MIKRYYCRLLPLLATTLVFTSCSFFSSDITEIYSIIQAQDELQRANDKTLVVFDMDETVIIRADNMVHALEDDIKRFDSADAGFVKQLREDLEKVVKGKADPELWSQKLDIAIDLHARYIPVEVKTIEIIKNLQARKVKVIALTNASARKETQKDREANLHEVGLNFSNSFDLKEAELDRIPKKFGFHPAFYHGILCTTGVPKGQVLATFLAKVGWRPNRVIFFDDRHGHCKNVAKEMTTLGISVHCYWYRAINKIKVNQRLVKYQLDYWIEHEKFVPENEALRALAHEQLSGARA